MVPGLMKEGCGKVTARGILFKRNRYTCPRAIREQWFEKAALEKEWKVGIVYNCELTEVIYLVDAEGELELCYIINTKNNIYSDIKLQRYFQSIQKLKALRIRMNNSKKYRNRKKKKALTWKS